MNNLLRKKPRLIIRFLFAHSRLHLIFNKWIVSFLIRFAYRFKLLLWLNKYPCKDFNDRGSLNRFALYQFVLETESLQNEIDYLEFGVAAGETLKWWLENNKNSKSSFIGFDTFTGLPEDWDRVSRGTFSTKGNSPQIQDARCRFEIGLFQDTLPGFLERYKLNRKTVVHIDCNLYSSTLFVLTALAHKFKKGDIVIFDELGSIRHPAHTFRAFCDFLSAYRLQYKLIGSSNYYYQIAVKFI